MAKKFKNYAWRDLDFSPKPQSDGDIKTADDLKAIRQSIIAILTTRKGERVMLPEFGSNVWAILFEPMDDITTDKLRDAVMSSIKRWEPRVEIGNVQVTPKEDFNEYTVNISFSIRGLSIAGVQNLDINLKRS